MGDRNRFQVTADFIALNFSQCRVADVAGGTGQLSFLLAQRGFTCDIVDPRETDLPKESRVLARRSRLPIRRIQSNFGHEMAEQYDLAVGLHPDGATLEICHSAKYVPVVIVPCCKINFNDICTHGADNLTDAVRRYFKREHIPFWESTLKMQGKNTVFVTEVR